MSQHGAYMNTLTLIGGTAPISKHRTLMRTGDEIALIRDPSEVLAIVTPSTILVRTGESLYRTRLHPDMSGIYRALVYLGYRRATYTRAPYGSILHRTVTINGKQYSRWMEDTRPGAR